MKSRLSTQSMLMLALLMVGSSFAFAQQTGNHLDLTAEQATLKANLATADGFHLQIAGPDDYYWEGNIMDTRNIQFTPYDENGELYSDGQYIMQVTPIFNITSEEQVQLRALQASSTPAALREYRAERGIPEEVEVQTIHFRILDGQFVTGGEEPVQQPRDNSQWEYHKQQQQEYLGLFGSVRNSMTSVGRTQAIGPDRLEKDHTSVAAVDQVFGDDVIIQGSMCVGMDCVNNENFGFDTQRLKENNLRIHFEDTSVGSFPSSDWRIIVNDSDNGGASYFAIQDADSGRIPFRIEAGSFDHTLYVDNSRRVGINTATPVTTIHSVAGDTPTLRLEQDQSSGWTPQTWDVAGNETNFFVRDVT
ncbi:MAG: hypothetical protein KDC54_03325, partial [Lewinella sp.]|nr:hypothetical protein [Lewinella sp.]